MTPNRICGEPPPGLLHPPGPRLLRGLPLRFTRKGRGGRRGLFAELNLTSMVDMLTILVVFLLQTFSASGELSVSRGVIVPEARNHRRIDQAPLISVSRDVVTLDGEPVADTAELVAGQSVDWRIGRLHEGLLIRRQNYLLLHPEPGAFTGQVLLMVDRGVDFRALKKILYTCTGAGYINHGLGVREKG